MLMIIDPADYTVINSLLLSGPTFTPTIQSATIDNNDNVLFCGTAAALGTSWTLASLAMVAVTADTSTGEINTDLTPITGVTTSPAGTNQDVLGTEDTGEGGDEMLIVTYNPE